MQNNFFYYYYSYTLVFKFFTIIMNIYGNILFAFQLHTFKVELFSQDVCIYLEQFWQINWSAQLMAPFPGTDWQNVAFHSYFKLPGKQLMSIYAHQLFIFACVYVSVFVSVYIFFIRVFQYFSYQFIPVFYILKLLIFSNIYCKYFNFLKGVSLFSSL